jgi:hypothetical protein
MYVVIGSDGVGGWPVGGHQFGLKVSFPHRSDQFGLKNPPV